MPQPRFGGTPASAVHPNDPHGIGAAVGRLSLLSRRSAKGSAAVLGATLRDGDVVEALVQGRFRGASGIAALVGGAVVLANDRQWKPDVLRIDLGPGVHVKGWQDDRSASLTFVVGGGQEVVESVADRPLAVEMAQRVRDRIARQTTRIPDP
jgi:hypothetical protein